MARYDYDLPYRTERPHRSEAGRRARRRRAPGGVFATRDSDRPGRFEPERGFAGAGRRPTAAPRRPRRVIGEAGETASGAPLYEDDYYGATPAELGMRDFSEHYGRYSGGSPYGYEYSERSIHHEHPLVGYDIGFTRPLHGEGRRRFPAYGRGYESRGRASESYGPEFQPPRRGRGGLQRRGQGGLPRRWW